MSARVVCRAVTPLVISGLSSYLLCACGDDWRAPPKPSRLPVGFSVLTQRANADDLVPKQVAEALKQSIQPGFTKFDILAARRVLPDTVWLVPAANGELCVARLEYPLIAKLHGMQLTPAAAIACVVQPAALAGKLVVTRSLATAARGAPAPTQVLGIVPDGISNIRVVFRHGRTVLVNVIRNGYEAIINGPERMNFQIRRAGKDVNETVRLLTPSFHNAAPSSQSGQAF